MTEMPTPVAASDFRVAAVHPPAGVIQQWATRAAFLVIGFSMGAWAPLVPFAKGRAGLDERQLGLLLLCLGGGSLLTMPIGGVLAGRFGCRVVILVSGAFIILALPLVAVLANVYALAGTLAVFGAAVGTIDVAINTQAILVERDAGRPMMSGFHGHYSMGGILGAAGVTGLLGLGLSPLHAIFVVVGVVFALLAVSGRHLLPYGGERGGPLFAVPHGRVLVIGLLCFIVFLAEGSMLDWGAIYLTDYRHFAPTHAGVGYALFAVAMSGGRLAGDRIVHALGGVNILLFGSLIAASGFVVAVLVPWWPLALAGFALVGLGASNIVPVLTTAVGRQTIMPASLAIATTVTIGYTGILTGPAMIGFVAHVFDLRIALLIVAAGVLVVTANARIARPQG